MKVKLLISRGGPGLSQDAGEEVDVSTKEGERMIAADQAVAVESVGNSLRRFRWSRKETATKPQAAEKAIKD